MDLEFRTRSSIIFGHHEDSISTEFPKSLFFYQQKKKNKESGAGGNIYFALYSDHIPTTSPFPYLFFCNLKDIPFAFSKSGKNSNKISTERSKGVEYSSKIEIQFLQSKNCPVLHWIVVIDT